MRFPDFEQLTFEKKGNGVTLITIDRPEKLNAADERLHRELVHVWRTIDDDVETKVSVITGAGRAFCAGGDLDMVEKMTRNRDLVLVQLRDTNDLVQEMVNSTKPIVSAINGAAVGAGLAVALLSDISIMSEDAHIADGHVRLGVAAGDHAAICWPLLCGMAKAKYHLLLSEFIDGPEAARLGLVSKCVAHDEVLPVALEIADRLARGSQTAAVWTKRVLNQWYRIAAPIFEQSVALEMMGFLGEDAREGARAALEKRAPRFPSAAAFEGAEPPPAWD